MQTLQHTYYNRRIQQLNAKFTIYKIIVYNLNILVLPRRMFPRFLKKYKDEDVK